MMAEREHQQCSTCGKVMKQEFSPPSTIYTPEAFKHSFGELFGTSSEKDYRKANPHAVPQESPSRFRTRRQQDESRWAKARKDGAEVEQALRANATLTAPRGKKKKGA
jgi:hypothetical protein